MKTINKLLIAATLGTAFVGQTYAAELDSKNATVSMSVGQFASITGLDDFVLSTLGSDGAAGAIYSGSDAYNLESNAQVRVSLSGGNLTNGSDSVSTSYSLDGGGLTFDTTSDSVHNGSHTIAASATLGDISAQKAGAYSTVITLTVASL